MDAACTIQDSIHVFSLVHKYVSRILGTYQNSEGIFVTFYYIHVHFWKKNVPWHIHGLSDFSFNKIFAVLYI